MLPLPIAIVSTISLLTSTLCLPTSSTTTPSNVVQGTSTLPQPDGAKEPVMSTTTLNEGHWTPAQAGHVILHRALAARIDYVCPEIGIQTRTMAWEARFYFDGFIIRLLGIRLIDRIDPIHVNQNDFSAYFHHSYCHVVRQNPPTVCFYHIRVQTFGTILRTEIAMDLTTDSHFEHENPTITESCLNFEHLLDPDVCPAEHEPYSADLCTVLHVRVWDM